MPHAGDWEKARVWQASEQITLPVRAMQLGVTDKGTEPAVKSFLEITPDCLNVSAIKRSENGKGWVVRLFNPSDKEIQAKIRFNNNMAPPDKVQTPVERIQSDCVLPPGNGKKWSKIRQLTLEELPEKDLKADPQGRAAFSIGKKKILTIEFLKNT